MRIDPKYFNRFIAITAAITVLVIIYSTFRYFDRQVSDFKENVSEIRADTLSFRSYSNFSSDSLFLKEMNNKPVIIHFWSTWSDKSLEVGNFLMSYKDKNDLVVIAAAVRDNDQIVQNFVENHTYDFHFVEGTGLYQTLKAPGLPAQIFLNTQLQIIDSHVGNDTTEIRTILDPLFLGE